MTIRVDGDACDHPAIAAIGSVPQAEPDPQRIARGLAQRLRVGRQNPISRNPGGKDVAAPDAERFIIDAGANVDIVAAESEDQQPDKRQVIYVMVWVEPMRNRILPALNAAKSRCFSEVFLKSCMKAISPAGTPRATSWVLIQR
jgi:hypothetical protein